MGCGHLPLRQLEYTDSELIQCFGTKNTKCQQKNRYTDMNPICPEGASRNSLSDRKSLKRKRRDSDLDTANSPDSPDNVDAYDGGPNLLAKFMCACCLSRHREHLHVKD